MELFVKYLHGEMNIEGLAVLAMLTARMLTGCTAHISGTTSLSKCLVKSIH